MVIKVLSHTREVGSPTIPPHNGILTTKFNLMPQRQALLVTSLVWGWHCWSRPWPLLCPPRWHRSSLRRLQLVPPSNKGCDDFIILFSFCKCLLVIDPSFGMYRLTRTVIVCCYSDFPAFFQRVTQGSEVDYRGTQNLVSPSGLLQGDTTLSILAVRQWIASISSHDHI